MISTCPVIHLGLAAHPPAKLSGRGPVRGEEAARGGRLYSSSATDHGYDGQGAHGASGRHASPSDPQEVAADTRRGPRRAAGNYLARSRGGSAGPTCCTSTARARDQPKGALQLRQPSRACCRRQTLGGRPARGRSAPWLRKGEESVWTVPKDKSALPRHGLGYLQSPPCT